MPMKRPTKLQIQCAVVIFGVIIVPLLYSFFYLSAFWDPYSRLSDLPVAVVNQDAGAMINGESRNLGQEMCDRLKEDGTLNFIFTSEDDARTGTEGNDYYAMIVIPSDFSLDIASATQQDKHTASLQFSPNEKHNFLAGQILSKAVQEMEKNTRESITRELVNGLADQLKSAPDQLSELQAGLTQLHDGSEQLTIGTEQLKDGTATFAAKFQDYEKGLSEISNGSGQLSNGAMALDKGLNDLLEGVNALSASATDVDQLPAGAQSLAAGTKLLNDNLILYTAGVDNLLNSVTGTSSFLTNYATSVNPSIMKDPVFASFISQLADPEKTKNIQTLQASNAQLKTASAQLAEGAAQLASGTTNLSQLKAALAQLSQGLAQAKTGAAGLAQGSASLYEGLTTLNSATLSLNTAAQSIRQGASDLNQGSVDLEEGLATAQDGVSASIRDTGEQLKSLDGLGEFAKAPVTIDQETINPVPNYGTAFAPYFLSLSLWVGALMIFFGIYLDADSRFKFLSRGAKNKVARGFAYLLIGFAQAIVLGLVLKLGLGLNVDNLWLYFLSCCLVSMVFIAIVQFLLVNLKDLGKFLALALLILQLTSCAGTFPLETVPGFFKALYPYMPMTYSVNLFKQAISGVDGGAVWHNSSVLVAILIIFMGLNALLAWWKIRKEVKPA